MIFGLMEPKDERENEEIIGQYQNKNKPQDFKYFKYKQKKVVQFK